jgi:thiamine biosynthesis lipoprotein
MRYILALLLVLSACQKKQVIEHKGVAMTIPYRILVETEGAEKTIAACFETINSHYNNWNPDSEISRLSSQKQDISPGLYKLLELAQKISHLSQGRFDPTVAPLAKAWKENQEFTDCTVGLEHLHLEKGECWLDAPITLDLGGIAKGYGVDLIAETLQKEGFEHIYVEWGGEIRTMGQHPEGRPWSIGVVGIGTIPLHNSALATSGSYAQSWEKEGKSYTHIIDPRTKRPLATNSVIASATVLAPTCAEADAIATALMLFETPDEALAWVASIENVQCWLGTL